MLKAVVACLLGKLLLAPYGYSAEGTLVGGIAVCLGHVFPALLGFHGGKGVLSGFTVALMADWRCGLPALLVFGLCLWLTRYVSVSSIVAVIACVTAFSAVHWQEPAVAIMLALLGALIVFMHRSNISRLVKGTERKATFSKFRKKTKQ